MTNLQSISTGIPRVKHLYEMFSANTTKTYHEYKKQNQKQLTIKITKLLDQLHLKPINPLSDDLEDTTKAHFSSIVESNNSKKTKYFIKIILKEDDLMKKMIHNNTQLGQVLKKNKSIELAQYTPELVESGTNFLLYEFINGANSGSRYNDSSVISIDENNQIISILKKILSFDLRLLSDDIESYNEHFYNFYCAHNSFLRSDKQMYKNYIDDKTLCILEKVFDDKSIQNLINRNAVYLTHNDFRPANLMKVSGKIMVVDWDLYGTGIKYHDIARFYNFYYSSETAQKIFINTWLNEKMSLEEQVLFYLWHSLESFHETNMVLHKMKENMTHGDLQIIKVNFQKRVNKLSIFTDRLNELLY